MKISVIMQVYLGEYPGSRSDSDKKFLRAVQSFIDQSDKDSELIIVSDGCNITHDLYYKYYKKNDRIKYIYVDKDTPNMYEGEQTYYRGLPRQVGRSLVTGEVTTYMDSDDFLLSDAIEKLKQKWNIGIQHNKKVLINTSWYYNLKYKNVQKINILEKISIPKLPSKWLKVSIPSGFHNHSSICISHVHDMLVKWKDTLNHSEDGVFIRSILNKYGNTGEISTIDCPYYAVCHLINEWDY